MCDPRNSKINLNTQGSLLQMSRMMPRFTPQQTVRKLSVFNTPMSSDGEEDDKDEPVPETTSTQLHTLKSLMELKQQLDKAAEPKVRVPEREIPSVPSVNTFGVDPSLFKMIYNLGYDAGLDKRDPIPPCGVCEERRRKNRIAAADQRKRQREEYEEEKERNGRSVN
jgi:hypothetical protein